VKAKARPARSDEQQEGGCMAGGDKMSKHGIAKQSLVQLRHLRRGLVVWRCV
jgi:hypothetical protein